MGRRKNGKIKGRRRREEKEVEPNIVFTGRFSLVITKKKKFDKIYQ